MALGGTVGRAGDDLRQVHAQRQELRQGGGQIEGGSGDALAVQVGADGVGGKALIEGGLGHREREAAAAVADVEQHPALARLPSGVFDAEAVIDHTGVVGGEAVGYDVALYQVRGDILEEWGGPPTWTISGSSRASAATRATLSASRLFGPVALMLARTLMP